jgi:H+-transporting ATPase
MGSLASSDGGKDPVDAAIRAAASQVRRGRPAKVAEIRAIRSCETKMSEATAVDGSGATVRAS